MRRASLLLSLSLWACTYTFPTELVPCSTLASRTTELAPAAPARPALGETYLDPMFGTCITRVSDLSLDEVIPSEPRETMYPLDEEGMVSPDGTIALFSTGSYRLYAYDLESIGRGRATEAYAAYTLGFHGSALLSVDAESRTLEDYSVETNAWTPVSSFGSSLPAASTVRGNGRLALDGARVLLVVAMGGIDYAAVLEVATGTLVGLHESVGDQTLLSRSGRWVVGLVDGRWRLLPADFSTEGVEVAAERSLVAADTMVLAGGHDGLAVVDGTQLVVFDLDAANGTPTEVARVPLVDPGFLGRLELGVVVDGGAVDRPGWLVITMGQCTAGSTMCTDPNSWARPKIALVGLGADVVIHDLAWHFGSDVHAVPTRDLRRIVFSSDWDGGASEAYVIEVPTPLLRLP